MNYNSNSSLGSLRNFIINNNNSNRVNYSTKKAGENFARNQINRGLIKTRTDLRWLARHMYRFSGNTPWFHGGLNVISNRIRHLNKLRNKWRIGVRKIRTAKNFRSVMRREVSGANTRRR